MKRIQMLLLLLVLAVSLHGTAYAAGIYQLGDRIEDFTVTTYDGQSVTLYDVLKEKDMVLLNIWATWCGPCRSEFPSMEEAYKQYQDQIEIIALSSEPTDTHDVLAAFVAEMGLTFKVGQDTPNLSAKFGVTGIPTSVIVDRNGVICYIESGAVTSTDIFTRLFDVFVDDEYTQPVLLNGIPPMRPTVAPSAEADIAAALEVASAANPVDPYTWPMIVAEVDERQVVTSSNHGVNDSTAAITATVGAKTGDAIVVTFKTSTELTTDVLTISLNGEKVKSFTGNHDWMTYAISVPADGDHEVTLSYTKDATLQSGEDRVWVDSIVVLGGSDAAEALAANPVYPVSDANRLLVTNPAAREIIITDPTGLMAAYFGADCRYFIVNDDIASFHATITADLDPEVAFLYSNYDRRMTPLSQAMTADGYVAESRVDSIAITGYEYTNMVIYPDMSSSPVATVMFFKDEENVNSFVNNNLRDRTGVTVGSWAYAEEPATKVTAIVRDDGLSDYVLKCIDQDGNPVPGVMMQVCNESTCQVFISDANGVCEFTNPAFAWEVHILMAPEGYTADSTDVILAPIEGGEMVFTLTKN